jgi:hypothetical protein
MSTHNDRRETAPSAKEFLAFRGGTGWVVLLTIGRLQDDGSVELAYRAPGFESWYSVTPFSCVQRGYTEFYGVKPVNTSETSGQAR